jgi:MFS family permease
MRSLKETMTNGQRPSFSELFDSYPTAIKASFGVWKSVPRSMLYLFVSLVVTTFGFASVQLYLVLYATRVLLIDEAVWPLILTVLFITTIVLSIPAGKIVDKVNRKFPLLMAYILFGASMWIFVNGDLYRLFVSLVFVGVGNVMMNAAFSALQADLTPREQRGKVNGFVNFTNFIIMALGNLVGGILYERVSPQLPFFLATMCVVPSFLLALFMVKEPEKREE